MSDRKTVSQTLHEISSSSINIESNSDRNEEIDSELEIFLFESLLRENNFDLDDNNIKNIKSRVRIEQVKVIDSELEARLQKLEKELIFGYEQEESKEEKVFEKNVHGKSFSDDYEDDLPEYYYNESYCHVIGIIFII